MTILADPAAAVTVMHQISRLLLTVGVGLFLGYLVLIVGANLFGLVPRYAGRLLHEKQASRSAVPSAFDTSQHDETLVAPGSDRKDSAA